MNGKVLDSGSPISDFRDPNFKTGIVENLVDQMKGNKGTFVFGVGVAQNYHSTIIVAFNNGQIVTDEKGVKHTATEANPMFVFVEDGGGARAMNSTQLENKLKEFVIGAANYYSGRKSVGGKAVTNNQPKNISSTIDNLE